MSQEISLDVGWGKLAAKVHGPENGRPILALHGWLDNAATFDRLIPLLSQELRIVSLDLPGHGLSDHRPAGTNYHFIDSVVDAILAAEQLGWSRYTLLGHSLGGGVASMIAGAVPERIKALVLVEALGPLSWEAAEGPKRLHDFIANKAQLADKRLPVYPTAAAAAEVRRQAGDLTVEAATVLIERGTKPVEGGVTWRSDMRLKLPSVARFTEDQVLAYLKAIACPTLLLRAASGLPFEERFWNMRSATVAHLDVRSLPGNHHLHLNTPDIVAPVISDFLKDMD